MRPAASLRGVLASALVVLIVAVGILTLAVGYSGSVFIEVIQVLTVLGFGAIVIGGVIMLVLVKLGDWRTSEEDFDVIVRRAERMAAGSPWDGHDDEYGWDDEDDDLFLSDDEDFKALVRSAVDELPLEFHRALEHVAIVVEDGGSRVRAGRGRRAVYGIYEGDTVTEDYFHDRVVIFRDTLMRDFGHDPDALREQVLRTVRHELSRRLGIGASDDSGLS